MSGYTPATAYETNAMALREDARLPRPLAMLRGSSTDLAIVRQQDWAFFGGQIYFIAGPAATQLIDLWCNYCEQFPQIRDQVSLGSAWWELSLQETLNTQNRRSKVGQGASARPEFGRDEVPQWWREAAARGAPFPLDAAQRSALGLA